MSNNNGKQRLELTATKNTHTMCNNNSKQPLVIESLSTNGKAKAPSTTSPTVSLSHSDKASSSSTTIINVITEVNQSPGESDDPTIRSPFICKVSSIVRDLSESSFTPQVVSIGPIHREDPKLQEFEWQKEGYRNDLLNRCEDSTSKKTLSDTCLLKVNTLIPEIRKSYSDVVIKNYKDDELARMMVMDGCFILEFCFKLMKKHVHLPNMVLNTRISKDLMLLENQVPFFVLQALFDCLSPYMVLGEESVKTLSQVLDRSLARYAKLFRFHDPASTPTHPAPTHVDSAPTHKHDHVLGYLHKRYQLVVTKSEPGDTAFHSAVELDRSGMKFKCHQENVWSMTITFQSSLFACLPLFWSKPTLLMPTLVMDDGTELILRNFIAYEQSFPQDLYCFTSYAIAMDLLIDTQEDIAKLVESKVLVNDLGSNQAAADMINKMGKNIVFDDFYYNHEFVQMDKYYNGFWPKHIARLRRVYFSNPWSILH